MNEMNKLESFAQKCAVYLCIGSILSLVGTTIFPTINLGVPGSASVVLFTVFLCILHAVATKGWQRALGFTVFSGIVSWFVEFIGCNYGWWFGDYEYTEALGFSIGNVPLLVVFSWEGVIYPSLLLVDELLGKSGNMNRTQFLVRITLASLATGLIVTAWDIMADPLSVHNVWWKWDFGGAYLPQIDGGVPFSNFGGWIGAVFIISFLYRIVFTSAETENAPKSSSTLVGASLYTTWFCVTGYGLVHAGLYLPLFLGVFTMGPVIVLAWTRLYAARRAAVQHAYVRGTGRALDMSV